MNWKAGKRDIWDDDGRRVAEIHSHDWPAIARLVAAAPELYEALSEMLVAFKTARDTTVSVRLANERRCANARRVLAKASATYPPHIHT